MDRDMKLEVPSIYYLHKSPRAAVYRQSEDRAPSSGAVAAHRLTWLALIDRPSAVLFLLISC